MLLALAAALLAIAPSDTVPAGGIRGMVQSDPSGVPLELAIVEVESGGRRLLDATTDSAGGYRIARVPAGRRLVRVRHLDHAPVELEVLVPAGVDVVLDFALTPRPLALPAVEVHGSAAGTQGDTALASQGEMALLSSHALEAGASGAAAALGSGAWGDGAEPGDPDDVLFVRGSAADLKLVLLDGAPVYAPFHTGGLIHTFEPEALGSARLYLGGAPARYDGGLSYVMEMRTRAGRPERHQLAGSVDAVSGRALAEGPLPLRGTYLAVARGLHDATARLVGGGSFPFAYAEGLLRADFATGGSSRVALMGFANREGVRLDTASAGDPFARWANAAGSVRWRGTLGNGTDVEATAALTGYAARLPWRGTHALEMEAGIGRARVAVDLAGDAGAARLRYGAAYDRTTVRHDARPLAPDAGGVRLTSRDAGAVGSAYVDAAWQPRRDVALRAGLRADVFSQGVASLSPRLSGTWLAGERLSLTLAAGRYHQMVRVPRTGDGPPRDFADSLGLGTGLSVSRATHLALTLDQQVGSEVRLGLEAFVKRFEGVFPLQAGRASQSGVDVWVRHGGEPVSGWVGYSLSWSWEDTTGQGSGRFAGRHLLSAGAEGELPGRARLALRVAYGAGLPYTALFGPGAGDPAGGSVAGLETSTGAPLSGGGDVPPLTTAPDEPYLRLDAELSRTWTSTWRGRSVELTPYVRVLNALDRRDSLFYARDPDGGDPSVATLPLLPVAGFSFRF